MKTQKEIENRAKWKFQSLDNSVIESKAKAMHILSGGELTTQEFIIASGWPREKAISLLSSLELERRIEKKNGKWHCK